MDRFGKFLETYMITLAVVTLTGFVIFFFILMISILNGNTPSTGPNDYCRTDKLSHWVCITPVPPESR